MKKYLGWVIILVLIVGLFGWWKASQVVPNGKYDQFAQCVASKGLTMYGAYWCPHCKAEKARFGTSFQYVPYVECTKEVKLCTDKGVKGYPTWIMEGAASTSTQTRFEGELGLEKIAEITGCELPQ